MSAADREAAAALCAEDTDRITSSFVPAFDLVEFPEWKKSDIKQHLGWFFLGLKAGCNGSPLR